VASARQYNWGSIAPLIMCTRGWDRVLVAAFDTKKNLCKGVNWSNDIA
jgi:hypothetical protein